MVCGLKVNSHAIPVDPTVLAQLS
jgi:hypothetical protein